MAPQPEVGEVYRTAALQRGVDIPAEVLAQRFRNFFRRHSSDHRTSEAAEQIFWREAVTAAFADHQLADDCFQELYDHFSRFSAWRIYDDVHVAVRRLREAGYRLLVATNFDARLHSVMNEDPELRQIGLRVVSSEVGWRKPDPRFYEALVRVADCPAGEILMIGDSEQLDVLPARAAGLEAVHLNREEPDKADGRRVIASLLELFAPDGLLSRSQFPTRSR